MNTGWYRDFFYCLVYSSYCSSTIKHVIFFCLVIGSGSALALPDWPDPLLTPGQGQLSVAWPRGPGSRARENGLALAQPSPWTVYAVTVPNDTPREDPIDVKKDQAHPLNRYHPRTMMGWLTPEHITGLWWKEKLTFMTAKYSGSDRSESWPITLMAKPITSTCKRLPQTIQIIGLNISSLWNYLTTVSQ